MSLSKLVPQDLSPAEGVGGQDRVILIYDEQFTNPENQNSGVADLPSYMAGAVGIPLRDHPGIIRGSSAGHEPSGKGIVFGSIFILPLYYDKTPQPMKPQSIKERIATDKGIHRSTMLEMGMYNIHKEKAYKDKSKYTRKEKHRKPPKDE